MAHDYRPGLPEPALKHTRHLSLDDGGLVERYSHTYAYDLAGNLEQIRHNGQTQTWIQAMWVSPSSNRSLPARNHNDLAISEPESRFDANGNCLYMPHLRSVEWNYRNNISRVVIVDRSAEGRPSDTEYYLYGSDGMRLRKVHERLVRTGGGGPDVVEVTEKIYLNGAEIKRVVRNGELLLERTTSHIADGTNRIALLHQWRHDPRGIETDDVSRKRIHYQLSNHLGSASLEVDAAGNLISYEEYFPFGGAAFITGRNRQEVSLKDYRYSGKERDDATGLYYYGFRYYVPWTGRWLSPDPIGPEDGLNLYQFVRNNPVNLTDPNGLQTTEIIPAVPRTGTGQPYNSSWTSSVIAEGESGTDLQVSEHSFFSHQVEVAFIRDWITQHPNGRVIYHGTEYGIEDGIAPIGLEVDLAIEGLESSFQLPDSLPPASEILGDFGSSGTGDGSGIGSAGGGRTTFGSGSVAESSSGTGLGSGTDPGNEPNPEGAGSDGDGRRVGSADSGFGRGAGRRLGSPSGRVGGTGTIGQGGSLRGTRAPSERQPQEGRIDPNAVPNGSPNGTLDGVIPPEGVNAEGAIGTINGVEAGMSSGQPEGPVGDYNTGTDRDLSAVENVLMFLGGILWSVLSGLWEMVLMTSDLIAKATEWQFEYWSGEELEDFQYQSGVGQLLQNSDDPLGDLGRAIANIPGRIQTAIERGDYFTLGMEIGNLGQLTLGAYGAARGLARLGVLAGRGVRAGLSTIINEARVLQSLESGLRAPYLFGSSNTRALLRANVALEARGLWEQVNSIWRSLHEEGVLDFATMRNGDITTGKGNFLFTFRKVTLALTEGATETAQGTAVTPRILTVTGNYFGIRLHSALEELIQAGKFSLPEGVELGPLVGGGVHAEVVGMRYLSSLGVDIGWTATTNLGCSGCQVAILRTFNNFLHLNPRGVASSVAETLAKARIGYRSPH